MEDDGLTFSDEVSGELADLVLAELKAENRRRSPELRAALERYGEERPLHVHALEGGRPLGGLVGRTWVGWLHVELLWVREQGRGLGSRLLARAEELAAARGCVGARVETWSFQAPGFYQRRGYRIAGEVPGHPPGAVDYTLIKEL